MSFKESLPRSLKIFVVALLHLRSFKTQVYVEDEIYVFCFVIKLTIFFSTKLWSATYPSFYYY